MGIMYAKAAGQLPSSCTTVNRVKPEIKVFIASHP